MNKFIIVSVKHTKEDDKIITFWRPEDRGYCWRLCAAGRYGETEVLSHLRYYNNGFGSIAVPSDLADRLAQKLEYDTGLVDQCLPNDGETWRALIAGAIRPPAYRPRVGAAARLLDNHMTTED